MSSTTEHINDESIGAKSDAHVRQESRVDSRREEYAEKQGTSGEWKNSHYKSQIPRYTPSTRERRHSENSSAAMTGKRGEWNGSVNCHSGCHIHGIRSPTNMLFYEMLQTMSLTDRQVPDQIRAIHKNHVCSNVGKSRSVPTSKMPSSMTTPLSTPSTPTDSRRMPFHRNTSSQTSSPSRETKTSFSTTRHTNQRPFAEYMPLCELQKGLQKGDIVEGVLRINPRNYTDAYISAPGGGIDIYVGGMTDRNRALNGDRVAVHLKPFNEWKVLVDTIRLHWDEWGQQFDELLDRGNQWPRADSTPSTSAHTSHSNDIKTIDESDECLEDNDLNCDLNDTKLDTGYTERTGDTNISKGSTEANGKTGKKRRRSRKKNRKSDGNENINVKSPECIKTMALKPEVLNSLTISIGNKADPRNTPYKRSGVYDVLAEKLERIQTLKMESLLRLTFCESFIQRTGQVVAICEAIHSRIAGGRLAHMKERNQNWALFIPNDSRMPRLRIPMNTCPPDFFHHSQHYSQSLFVAQLHEWKTTDHFPSGVLLKHLGNSGDIEAESEMILTENQIEFDEFPNEALFGLPNIVDDEWNDSGNQWHIPERELQYRRDFRNECVFTIDPSTARDLDDALSVKRLNDGNLEIGVHIADVSYFVKEGMPLDEIARRRTTSVYLVQKVIPMLPRILCERLCSLNSGEEKLTFSVVWIIDKSGDILEEWFGRTIIKSCIKLSYELAQDMLDQPNRQWQPYELPTIHGRWSAQQISESVNLLNEIAVKLRKHRFESGALKIDKLKLHFILDKESGLPSGFTPYVYKDSNRLIEEFMLLANMAVAHRIYKKFDEKAFLRCHPQPSENGIKDFNYFCKCNGFQVDTSTSLTLQRTLEAIVNNDENISRVVANFLLKAMQMATYCCPGMQSSGQTLHHYALNVPLYTHFTSPIRRYADVIVHRLLSASLSYTPEISDSMKDLHRLAKTCNDKKLSARLASESSSRLFLNIYVKHIGKMETKGIVVQVFDHSFDVMVINCGTICRVYLNQLPLKKFTFETTHGKNQLILEWTDSTRSPLTITACLMVGIQVSINEDDITKLNAVLRHPN